MLASADRRVPVGVPEISPVLEFRLKPEGKKPLCKLKNAAPPAFVGAPVVAAEN